MNNTWLTAREGIAKANAHLSRTIAVDIGNTSYKLGMFNSSQLDAARAAGLPFSYPFSIDDLRILPHQLKVIPIWLSIFLRKPDLKSRPLLWLVSSVNRTRTQTFFEFLIEKRPDDIFAVLDQADVPIQTDYTDPTQLGIDRKLAALAASKRFPEPTPVLIVDIGTALKLDIVSRDGIFLGGVILPGPETQLGSLFKETDKLPELHWSARNIPASYPALNTNDAVQLGVAGGIVGAISYFYQRACRAVRQMSLPIIVTGGGSIGFEPYLRNALTEQHPETSATWIRTVRDLVQSGIELTRQSLALHQ
ncbi:MAG: type III pantothenate kinase [Thermoguttaceae bacterium]|nr:type III pantothenate kinase [Thermoguttaceae bacterium]